MHVLLPYYRRGGYLKLVGTLVLLKRPIMVGKKGEKNKKKKPETVQVPKPVEDVLLGKAITNGVTQLEY